MTQEQQIGFYSLYTSLLHSLVFHQKPLAALLFHRPLHYTTRYVEPRHDPGGHWPASGLTPPNKGAPGPGSWPLPLRLHRGWCHGLKALDPKRSRELGENSVALAQSGFWSFRDPAGETREFSHKQSLSSALLYALKCAMWLCYPAAAPERSRWNLRISFSLFLFVPFSFLRLLLFLFPLHPPLSPWSTEAQSQALLPMNKHAGDSSDNELWEAMVYTRDSTLQSFWNLLLDWLPNALKILWIMAW